VARPVVVFGFLGTVLDAGFGPKRWERWRPTVDLARREDLVVRRLELFAERDERDQASLAKTVIADVRQVSPETEVRTTALGIRDPWDFEEVYGRLHDFARAYPFRVDREDYLVHITTGTHVAQICLFLLAESRHVPARLLQTSPPRPPRSTAGSVSIVDLDLSKYARLASRFQVEKVEGLDFLKAGIATRSAAYNALIERIERVAIASKSPILLSGPTGAGKSQLARRIYELKKTRRQVTGDFVDVNCATLRGDAAMSTLFGHVKGAFTGALSDRPGLLRRADGGVLFLDEIGELGADEQAMLLRALEERSFFPMGSDKLAQSDFQLLAGSHRDLVADVASGRFREDLLARIHVWTFRLPGLRERPDDVAPNLDFEVDRVAQSLGVRVTMTRDARARFLAFAESPAAVWSGNFRDLNAAVTRMATLAAGGRIDADLVDDEIARLHESWRGASPPRAHTGDRAHAASGAHAADRAPAALGARDVVEDVMGEQRAATLDRFDRAQLADVLAVCRASPSLSAAGRELFAASRAKKSAPNDADRLRKYLARFGLAWSDVAPKA